MRLEKKHMELVLLYMLLKESLQPLNKWIHHRSHHHNHNKFLELVVQDGRRKKAFVQRVSPYVTAKTTQSLIQYQKKG